MTTSYRSLSRLVLIGMLGLIFAACSALAPGPDTSVNTLMPKLDTTYTSTDITKYQGDLVNLITAGSTVTGNLPVAAVTQVVGKFADCYKQAGAYAANLYVSKTNLINTGFVGIVNKTVALNPLTIFNCVSQSKGGNAPAQADSPITPCFKVHEFKYNDKDFIAFIGGTNSPVCTDMCNALPDAAACLAK